MKATGPSEAGIPALPAVVDRVTWQAERDALLVQEEAHARAGDAVGAARRRLPMVEVDPATTLIGPHGPVTLPEVFEGRRQLIARFHLWPAGRPASGRCEGCGFYNGRIRELSPLHSRDATYATFCHGPYDEGLRYRDSMGWDVPWYSARDSAAALLAGREVGTSFLACYLRHGDRVFETYSTTRRDVEVSAPGDQLVEMTGHGREDTWADALAGRPRPWPTARWSRPGPGRPDDVATGTDRRRRPVSPPRS